MSEFARRPQLHLTLKSYILLVALVEYRTSGTPYYPPRRAQRYAVTELGGSQSCAIDNIRMI